MLDTRPMDYREIIKIEFLKRRNEDPFYSLRAFSKALGIAPSHLSYLLRGERGLSKDNAIQVAYGLGLKNGYLNGSFGLNTVSLNQIKY